MRLTFLLGTLFGILLGGAAGWGWVEYKLQPKARTRATAIHYFGRSPEEAAIWLLPKNAGVSSVFSDEKALRCVLNPESVTAHLADAKGRLKMFEHRFTSGGIQVEKSNVVFLKRVWEAPNAYCPPSMCIFNPGVLLDFKNGEDSVKILICFHCQDMRWALNDHDDDKRGMGLTEFAAMTLKAVLRQSFPGNPAFL